MKLKPFIRWAGGKQSLLADIVKNIPSDVVVNNYYEPFVGAGSLFLGSDYKRCVISDVNAQLINAYSQIKKDYIRVFNLLLSYYKSFDGNPEYYYKVRRIFNKDKKNLNYIQASRFIFLIHTNYNGMYRLNRKGEYNVPIGKLSPSIPTIDYYKELSNKLVSTNIICADYKDALTTTMENDFIYLDPPYPPLDWEAIPNQYTVCQFSKEDHEEVATVANDLREKGCKILISYPDIPFIRELYSNWNINNINAFRSISCKKERKKISEILIKNY